MGKKITKESEEKGKKAEKIFSECLDKYNIPFMRIDQKEETFSKELKSNEVHRPDYIIKTKKGNFNIDVKFREKKGFGKETEKRFILDQEYNINGLYNLQKTFNLDVWVAFTDDLNTQNFKYAPIFNIYEYRNNILNILRTKYSYDFYTFPKCFIYIPDILLYDHLSCEKGFYNEKEPKKPDAGLLEEDTRYYVFKCNSMFPSRPL